MLDLVIRNARICDGSGDPSFPGAIGVRDGRIVDIGAFDLVFVEPPRPPA